MTFSSAKLACGEKRKKVVFKGVLSFLTDGRVTMRINIVCGSLKWKNPCLVYILLAMQPAKGLCQNGRGYHRMLRFPPIV